MMRCMSGQLTIHLNCTSLVVHSGPTAHFIATECVDVAQYPMLDVMTLGELLESSDLISRLVFGVSK